jgi:NAD-dependent deacetylase
MLPEGVLERAGQAAREADVALVIGTSSMVYPAAELPAIVEGRGGRVIEINPEATPLSLSADLYWQAAAGEALPGLVEALQLRARSRRDGT